MGIITEFRRDLEGEAFRLFREYHGQLTAEALTLCANPSVAEDLVMRAFEAYFSGKSNYDPAKGDLLPWLKGVLRGIYRDSTRGKARAAVVYLPPEELQVVSDARTECGNDGAPLSADDEKLVSDAIQSLSPKLREAVLLHYYESKSIGEIARLLRVTEGGVKNRLFYARKILAKKLGRKLGRGGAVACLVALFAFAASAAVAYWFAGETTATAGTTATTATTATRSARDSRARRSEPAATAATTGSVGVACSWGTSTTVVATTSQTSQLSNFSTSQLSNFSTSQLSHSTPLETQTMKMTSTLAAAALAVTTAVVTVEADGITLAVDQIKQRYPWNGLVDIDYTVTYDNAATLGVDDNLEVILIDRDATPAVTNRAITFLQAPLPLTAGAHRITWDANADGVTNRIEQAEYHVKLVHYSETYMVIDVSGGSSTNCYPVDFLNGAPANGFNVDEYKGNKIVLRRIHPGSYVAGSPTTEANRTAARETQHRVAFSQPFYIGLFEITQQQYYNVMGAKPSSYQGDYWQYRPVEKVSYNTIRGGSWPTSAAPGSNTFMDKLLQKCKSKDATTGAYTVAVTGFDLPTDFQWEYACRAGTTNAFNTTTAFDNTSSTEQETQLKLLGRYKDNQTDGKGGISAYHTIVGSYLPNAWGLYDMHGNVWEWCRDWYQEDAAVLKQYKDPVGAASGSDRVKRSGGWASAVGSCRSAFRTSDGPSSANDGLGFRLSRTLP